MPIDFVDVMGVGEGIEERISLTRFGFNAYRTCKVKWSERWGFIGENILRPWPYVGVNAYCVEGTAKPFPESKTKDGGGGLLDFEYALVTLYYTTNIKDMGNGVIGWERLRGALESMPVRLPSEEDGEDPLKWSNGDTVYNGDAPSYISFPGMYYDRGYIGVSSIPMTAVSMIGCVNNAPLASLSLGVVFAPETLRYVDFSADRQINTTGADRWRLTYLHHFKPNVDSSGVARGWNWFWRPGIGDFQAVYNSSGVQYKPHVPANLSLIYP